MSNRLLTDVDTIPDPDHSAEYSKLEKELITVASRAAKRAQAIKGLERAVTDLRLQRYNLHKENTILYYELRDAKEMTFKQRLRFLFTGRLK